MSVINDSFIDYLSYVDDSINDVYFEGSEKLKKYIIKRNQARINIIKFTHFVIESQEKKKRKLEKIKNIKNFRKNAKNEYKCFIEQFEPYSLNQLIQSSKNIENIQKRLAILNSKYSEIVFNYYNDYMSNSNLFSSNVSHLTDHLNCILALFEKPVKKFFLFNSIESVIPDKNELNIAQNNTRQCFIIIKAQIDRMLNPIINDFNVIIKLKKQIDQLFNEIEMVKKCQNLDYNNISKYTNKFKQNPLNLKISEEIEFKIDKTTMLYNTTTMQLENLELIIKNKKEDLLEFRDVIIPMIYNTLLISSYDMNLYKEQMKEICSKLITLTSTGV